MVGQQERPNSLTLATEFSHMCNMITKPPPTPEEEVLETLTGIQIRGFPGGVSARALPIEMAVAIEKKARDLLTQSLGTRPYRDHLMETITEFTHSAMVRMLGSDFIVSLAGIDLEKGEAGMFDLQTVEQAELHALQLEAETGRSYTIPELQTAHVRKMKTWIPAFREKYHKDPFST